jgi:O-antigen/teichoic acid export membrane protein
VLIMVSGLIDYLQRGVFQPLLKQGFTQSVGLVRNVMFSSLILWAAWSPGGALDLRHVLEAELWAVTAAALSGLGFFLWLWLREAPAAGLSPRWTPPSLRAMARMSGYNYASQVLYSLGDSAMVLLVAGRMLDLQATAALGFCLGLYGQLLRYLPAHWLWGAIQPSLVAAYSRGRDFVQLNQQAMLVYKGSLFVVAPLVAFFIVFSEDSLNLLSHGKYGDAHWLALVLLVSVIPGSHRSVLSGLVNTVERPEAGAVGNLGALSTVPLGVLLVMLGFGPMGLVLAVVANASLYNLIVIRTLAAAGYHYRVDHGGLLKIALAVAATALCLTPFIMRHPTSVVTLGLMIAAGVLFLLWAYWIKPFNDDERSRVNAGFGRAVFVW